MVETPALGSVGKIYQENYSEKWNTWVKERKAQGKGPWLHTVDDPNEALTELGGGYVMWLGHAVSFVISWRASELCGRTPMGRYVPSFV